MCLTRGFVFFILCAHLLLCCRQLHGAIAEGATTGSTTGGLRIDISRKRSVQLNGVEIDEHSLLEHLEDHERELIFGKGKTKREVKLVHLRQRTDADARWPDLRRKQQHRQQQQRVKRDADNGVVTATSGAPTAHEVVAERQDAAQVQDDDDATDTDDHLLNLHLQPTPKLIDDAFVYIRRYANTTQFIENSLELAQSYANCFYSNAHSALDLCEEDRVRGILHHNSTDFIIHPLPARFGNSTHVLVAASHDHVSRHNLDLETLPPSAVEMLDAHIQFEPDEKDFNEKLDSQSNRSTRNINYTPAQATTSTKPANQDNFKSLLDDIEGDSGDYRSSYRPRYHYDQHHSKHQKHHQHQTHKQQHHAHKHGHHDKKSNEHRTNKHHNSHHQHHHRIRRNILSKIPQVLHIETAIFVDSDLFKHMAKNFPHDTEKQLIRFVLAMINGVQLLYHHPSLGHRVNFVLKRLEILFKDPADLGRSSDIDTYLSNFCMWQKGLNPASDVDSVHYDHAVILTGLDLYVLGKNNKVISQVVGLAPVAGMCTPTSSCTINEGKHFESVFVVAHEIGHNLGMRHDTKENKCDPTLFIMSPTLGSGKITWSKCSRDYLDTFLISNQAKCLFDRGQFGNNLDHAAEGILPGERFDATQQCMLKYGRETVRARSQNISDVCRDLHCQRDRYTWTSHPALEGTVCGDNKWCRSGYCIMRPSHTEPTYSTPKLLQNAGKSAYDKASFLESSKMGHLLHEYNYNKLPSWGDWGDASPCDSGCLYGPSKRLREGSTGLKTYTRSCVDRRRCSGRDRKFESCIAKQCYNVKITTIEDFATQVCEKAQKFDAELTGEGQQIVSDIEESCKVFCKTKSNNTKSRSWTFPDGTTCRTKSYTYDDTGYCIAGRCERFTCDNSTNNYYKIDAIFCQHRQQAVPTVAAIPAPSETQLRRWNNPKPYTRYADKDATYNRDVYMGGGAAVATTARNKYENEVAIRSYHGTQQEHSLKYKTDPYQSWNKYNYPHSEQRPLAAPPPAPVAASLIVAKPEPEWIVKSGCHSSCMVKSKGIQVVMSRRTRANNIQLCTHTAKPCDRLQTATEYAENTCARYKLKVRGLSGHGTQIAASVDEPDRSCRVGCQDEYIKYRFYLVNGKYGHFPLGTRCSNTEDRYCVNGKCLEFGADNIPLQESHVSLAHFRNRRSVPAHDVDAENKQQMERSKRSYLYYTPVNITERITQDFINNIIRSIVEYEQRVVFDELTALDQAHIEFSNPIHISTDELNMKK